MASKLQTFATWSRKIVCVGRNYAEHAKELGNKVPLAPILFLKPPTSFLEVGAGPVTMPSECALLHHEVELAVVIGVPGKNIPVALAMSHVGGYALALDMTARDLQDMAKREGLPWSVAKGFDGACPIGAFIPAARVPDPSALRLQCRVDGVLKQDGRTSDMLFPVPELVSFISTKFSLEAGDVILTGTPKGVGAVWPAQRMEATLLGSHDKDILSTIEFTVTKATQT